MEAGIITAIIAAIAAIVGGIVSGAFSLALQKRKHEDEQHDAHSDWEKTTDKRLTAVERRVKDLEERVEDDRKIRNLLLRGMMLLTRHAVDNNHNGDLADYAEEVNTILIENL